MQMILEVLLTQLVVPALLVGLSAAGAWVLTKAPGPVRDALLAAVHSRDMALVVGAMARRAAAALSAPSTAPLPAQISHSTVLDVVEYVRRELPETVAKLAPSEEALRTMAQAAVASAATDRAIVAAAAAPR